MTRLGACWKAAPPRLRAAVLVGLPYLLIFAALLIIALPLGADTPVSVYPMSLFADSATAHRTLGGSDAGSLLTAAISFYENHSLLADVFGVYSFWPPGMVVVDWVLLEIEGATGISIVFMMVLLTCLAWTALIGTWFHTLRRASGLAVAAFASAALLLYSGVTTWGTSTGLFFSDSFGAIGYAFAILALFAVARASSRRGQIVFSLLAGVALALGASFRATYELVSEGTLVLAAAVLLAAVVLARLHRGGRFRSAVVPAALPILVMSFVAQLIMLPWRLYAGLKIHRGDFRWSTVSDLTTALRWTPDQLLLERNGSFLIEGHANWACINDAATCASIYEKEMTSAVPYSATSEGYYTASQLNHLALDSFLAHPLTYIGERLQALWLGFASNTGGSVGSFSVAESLAILAVLVLIVVAIVRRGLLREPAVVFFVLATGAQIATLALFHMEPRYFLGVELGILLVGGVVLTRRRPLAPVEEPE